MTSKETALSIRDKVPKNGLFSGKNWRIAPEPFRISEKLHEELVELGPRLLKFFQACNLLYRQSVDGKQPAWIARYLDAGKPESLVNASREKIFKNEIPKVIRPDLLLSENGFSITELDSVPGGLGVTRWLQGIYADNVQKDSNELNIAQGFIKAVSDFQGTEPSRKLVCIVVSDEAKDYLPELLYLAEELALQDQENDYRSCRPEELIYREDGVYLQDQKVHSIYRFFELFDLPNIKGSEKLLQQAIAGNVKVTPPFKPQLEEKLWFSLFWFPQLSEYWRRELGDRYFRDLKKYLPFTWLLDPTPLPPHAVISQLEIQDWTQLKKFSQKQRDLILKISGFSELAWGSRGVFLGSDMPSDEWANQVQSALDLFWEHPYILQKFSPTALFEQSWFNFETDSLEVMKGRVRLCPYYFVIQEKSHLSGILATICPPDKKLIHGMEDAILTLGIRG